MTQYILLQSIVPVTQYDHGINFRYAGFDIVEVINTDEPSPNVVKGVLDRIIYQSIKERMIAQAIDSHGPKPQTRTR